MTTLGIALIVAGLTLVCGSMIFLLFSRREPSQESFEEDRRNAEEETPSAAETKSVCVRRLGPVYHA
jgi:hypothetical protein